MALKKTNQSKASVLEDNGRTRVEMERNDPKVTFRVTGIIDEDINLSVILQSLQELGPRVNAVTFDLGTADRINSCGVREWILLMERVPTTLSRSFVNLSSAFVEQANMVPSMLGKGKPTIVSFYAPYACDQCKEDRSMLITPVQVGREKGEFIAPRLSCPQCATTMKFDWIEDEYFGFLAYEGN